MHAVPWCVVVCRVFGRRVSEADDLGTYGMAEQRGSVERSSVI
jgi:hypothetical protein